MASVFTYDNASKVSSPWSTPIASTPQPSEEHVLGSGLSSDFTATQLSQPGPPGHSDIDRLEPERQDGPVEYKLHLLLRPRRRFSTISTLDGVTKTQYTRPIPATTPVSAPALQPMTSPSIQTRQIRLQQLTTQLLWRLQQSSPFHSSSTAALIIPRLPEFSADSGLPERPASLLPGLEESQGALYEIGVADDGLLIGLTNDELEESLGTLRAMGASLGCVVDVQRKVMVGIGRYLQKDTVDSTESTTSENLWVVEALVRPDLLANETDRVASSAADVTTDAETMVSDKIQLRVALVGCSGAGKSSLLGSLTTSRLDNGRGKSRLSLLKHRHEIASGITSSVAQEILGYREVADGFEIINYRSKDVTSWSDIHNAAESLLFLSDCPGLPKYSKSFYRSIVSWRPHWTIVCIPANVSILENSTPHALGATSASASMPDTGHEANSPYPTHLQHLSLSLALSLPVAVVITKLDIADRTRLRVILGQVLTIIKGTGKTPTLLRMGSETGQSPLVGIDGIDQTVNRPLMDELNSTFDTRALMADLKVPVIFTSCVTGVGTSQLHALLHRFSSSHGEALQSTNLRLPLQVAFMVDEVFMIPPSKVYATDQHVSEPSGVVICGYLAQGTISVGDHLVIGPLRQRRHSEEQSARHNRPATKGSVKPFSTGTPVIHVPASASAIDAPKQEHEFVDVKVVSLRNLRLPVRSLLCDQVGTIGVIPLESGIILGDLRKGAILASPSPEIVAHRTFVASFASADFASSLSPPLILGGHATVYIRTIRAAVRVISLALAETPDLEVESPQNLFDFENDDVLMDLEDNVKTNGHGAGSDRQAEQIQISFRFIHGGEWLCTGEQVFVVPTLATFAPSSTPGTGPTASTSNAGTGLGGFVGTISDLIV